jgi:hypothetical protein
MDSNEGIASFTSPQRGVQFLGRGTLAMAGNTVHKLLAFVATCRIINKGDNFKTVCCDSGKASAGVNSRPFSP